MRRWEFYNELDEIVCVVDMDSHQVVYMNRRACEVYKINDAACQEKRCYELLAGSASPCAACSNKKLKQGYFLEDVCYNPVVKRKLSVKETMIEENGRRYKFTLAVDMGPAGWQEEVGEDNEAMINEGLRISLSAPTPEMSINILLEYLGQSLNSERVYIFEEIEGGAFKNTYE